MKKHSADCLRWFAAFFLAAMFLPRLATQGMFGDGLVYASLARNLAEGKGSLWAPWFSSGYWLEFAGGSPYFENPPLMIWMQAAFFGLLGDHWWVEKGYSLLLFAFNAWLIVRLWEIPLRNTVFQGKYGWFPLLLWYVIPTVIWGNPNNLMDNNLLTFCLVALWCAADGLFSGRRVFLKLALAGLFVYLGLMTKGPVALYPVALPFLFAITAGFTIPGRLSHDAVKASGAPDIRFWIKRSFRGIMLSAWMVIVAVALFILMLALIPESRTYFENYWEKRLGVVLSGVRQDAELTGWARLSIFGILAKELSVVAAVFVALFFISRKKRIAEMPGEAEDSSCLFAFNSLKISTLFLLLGFAATLPLMFSARQSGMYILAGLPMFALAAGYFHLPLLGYWLDEPGEKTARFLTKLRLASVAGLFILAAYVVFLFGKPGREKTLLNDLPCIRQFLPEGEKVAVCEKLMGDLHAHAYLQRFHHLELSRDVAACRYALTDRACDGEMQAVLQENGFKKAGNENLPACVHFVCYKKDTPREQGF